jgi:hypothetical protein
MAAAVTAALQLSSLKQATAAGIYGSLCMFHLTAVAAMCVPPLLLLLLPYRKHEDMSEELIDKLASSSSLDLSHQQWGRVKDIIRGRITPGNRWGEGQDWLLTVSAVCFV